MAKKIFNGIKYTIVIVLVALLLFFGTYLVKKLIYKDKPFTVLGVTWYEVTTGSMRPDIKEGDLVIVVKRDKEDYKEEMVVTFLREGATKTTTHKIFSINGDEVVTYGINNNGSHDAPIDISCIIGEVVYVYKDFYKVQEFVTKPIGIISICFCGFALIEIYYFIEGKIFKKEEK